MDAAELEFGVSIGSGGFGCVYRGTFRGQEVAIKKLHLDNGVVTPAQLQEFKKEIGNMMELRHPRLIAFVGAALVAPALCIVTEFMPNGSLYDVLHKRKTPLVYARRSLISSQTVEGVAFLHGRSPPFVHRDLKSLNAVMDMELNVKLCDFGLTQSMEKTHISRRENEGGSPRYMAPELFDSKGRITEKIDIWALGCLILEIFTGRMPHEDCNNIQQVMTKTLIDKAYPFENLEGVDMDIRTFAELCFIYNPRHRIDAHQLLEGLMGLRGS